MGAQRIGSFCSAGQELSSSVMSGTGGEACLNGAVALQS